MTCFVYNMHIPQYNILNKTYHIQIHYVSLNIVEEGCDFGNEAFQLRDNWWQFDELS